MSKPKETLSQKRSRASLSRKTFAGGGLRAGAGRPKSDAPRCACGEMTLKRAETRKHKCVSIHG